ncbi:MAG: DNA recombination protein RmuC [Bacteroidetes bacterium]|nr:DNA recombination protein RmuC [Bacteroidota bacterium]
MEITQILFLVIGLVLGFLIGFLVKKAGQNTVINDDELKALTTENTKLATRLENAEQVFKQQKEKEEKLAAQNNELISLSSQLDTQNKNLEEKLTDQKAEIEKLQAKFTLEFQNIANKLLKENSSEFALSNQKRLDEILTPLKENIKAFEKKVEDKYDNELKERTSLIEQIKSLSDLNQQMRTDAQNLTKALKGDSKAQGNWGEFILEKILESSGLRKGEQYETQFTTSNDEGGRMFPDVVIKLPEDKHIVIDSKVSIVAYTNFLEAQTEEEQVVCVKAHIASVKSHINGLSEKNYAHAKGINSPDFVLMFLPSEPSFSFTLQSDQSIYNYAWDRKIVLVSPTTLLATLRTITSVWKQENQTKNAIEIAKQSGALYDKFVGFLEDLDKIDRGLVTAKTAYDGAVNKLKTGTGNLVGRVEKLKVLGAKTTKNLPASFNDDDNENETVEDEL